MGKWILAAAVTALFAVGCVRTASDTYQNSSGSIALSRDDALLYAVDTDSGIVAVIDVATQKKVAEVKVGAAPESVVVGPDDRIYVSNRGARSVSVIERGDWKEAARIGVGVEPTGLAISPDGKTLYVVNGTSLESAEYGTLTAIDTEHLQIKWDLPVGEEPRGIALTDHGHKALITLFKQGDLVQVDLDKPEVIRDNTRAEVGTGFNGTNRSALYLAANAQAIADGQAPGPDASRRPESGFLTRSSYHPRAAGSITTNPDGQSAYMTVTWAREDNIAIAPNNFGGYYAGGGPCGIGAVATPGLVTFNAISAEPVADDLTLCSTSGQDASAAYPPSHLKSKNAGEPLQGPVASVVDPTGAWLFVVARESKNVVIMPTARRTGDDLDFATTGTSIREQISVGNGANGIAITRDGKMAFVNNQFDHSVTVLRALANGQIDASQTIKTADAVITGEIAMGRKLFFDATDPRINRPDTTGVSCNTCHTEGGREDGHVWGFPDGKRQTPALVGRMLSQTAPFHWTGQFATLNEFFDHTTRARMGGTGISSGSAFDAIVHYMDAMPAPDNPHKHAELTEAQARGAVAFAKAGCGTCHGGDAFTLNTAADVGTIAPGVDFEPSDTTLGGAHGGPLAALNTPSLLGLARTAPYLHNGTALTLHDRIFNSQGDQHGQLSLLSESEKADLVEYLKTL
ncbi:MAG: hypothetical protein IRZ16_18420 [Myxococcaceae bacterium]|nr:hypothetical protein [Myxococcaceae bacterium]